MHITSLIGGVVRPHSVVGVNELTVNGVRNIGRVFENFDTHQRRTKKAESYRLWREVHTSLVNGEHLSSESRAVLKAKAATINKSCRIPNGNKGWGSMLSLIETSCKAL